MVGGNTLRRTVLSRPIAPSRAVAEQAVVERLHLVCSLVGEACARAGRDPSSVKLVGASKGAPVKVVETALAAGLRTFGENRVQEARDKWPLLRDGVPDLELHLIGPLQTNKVAAAMALFDVIQSLDRPTLCVALARQAAKIGRQPRLFVQVNIGNEPQKAGVSPVEVDQFIHDCRGVYGLDVDGIMVIPPVGDDPAPHFAHAVAVAERNGLASISMGMSEDFATAIEFGATHVRVGSAIFGPRGDPVIADRNERRPQPKEAQ
jgi:PLP dependent protein